MDIDTTRLHLRQWRTTDHEAFARINADPRVMAYYPAPLDRAASDAIAERCQSLIAQRGWGFWAVEIKNTGEFIGFVGLHIPTDALPFSPCVEIGWRLGYAYWGHGYATEAAQRALRVGFDDLGFAEIVSFATVRNRRSRAVMERLHMLHRGELFEHPAIPQNSALRQHCLYRLPRRHWAAQLARRKNGL